MKIDLKYPIRTFQPKKDKALTFTDVGEIKMENDNQVSLVSGKHKSHDFAAKNWGFYVTPSINGRLKNEGFKTALVKSDSGKVFLNFVDSDKIDDFLDYCQENNKVLVEWLDE